MPNDTTTLNGALRELGETMAANLTTQGVPSTYDEGLTTLAGKILDIQGGGGTRTLTLTADKSILSYYDSDTATLSATLLEDGEPVSGETVEFFSGSTSLGTSQTNSSGVAEKVYSSTGSGDVELSASVGTLSSETYELEDCIRCWDSLPYADTTVNYSLPSSFKIEFSLFASRITSSDKCVCFMRFNNSSGSLIGKASNSSGQMYFLGQNFSTLSANIDYDFTLSYENGVATLTDGTTTKTSSTTLSKIYTIGSWNYAYFKTIKIKPL